ncbi:response regulator [Gemmata sp. JC717]|uniref:response regulator n=1 Tax=Gemmata algarum TaxID=2975278 RepID=UPI0021BB3D58|nr:response regulator [Gemmata algarum]MDY3556891.1 response regulator [Gemmata algarum]
MRLLWVENHAGFVRVAARQFLGAHALTVVPSLAAAKEALERAAFDAVLLDYDLDDGKGTELVALVQSLSARVVVIAASAHEEGNAALLAAGADAACPKTKFAAIAAVLESVCGAAGT